MEYLKYDTEGASEELMLFKRQKYTPQGFTDKVYRTQSLIELKTIACGAIPLANLAADSRMAMDTVTANISLARENKPTTIEFRQHEGSLDPDNIYWWALFLGRLVRYADLLTQLDLKFLDEGPPDAPSPVEAMANKSILDLLTFPQEGKQYFITKKNELYNEEFNMKRELDNRVVKERIKRRALGRDCNSKMNKEIQAEQWYKEAKAILDAKLKPSPQSNSSSKPPGNGDDDDINDDIEIDEDDSDSW